MSVIFKSMTTFDGVRFDFGIYNQDFDLNNNKIYNISYPATTLYDFVFSDLGLKKGDIKEVTFTCGNKMKINVAASDNYLHIDFYNLYDKPAIGTAIQIDPISADTYKGIYINDNRRPGYDNLAAFLRYYTNEGIPERIDKPGIYYEDSTKGQGFSMSIGSYIYEESAINDFFNALDDTIPDDPGGNSGEGGGSGTFDNKSDPVDFPTLPTLSAVSAGFVSLYAPTLTQMNNLSSYMWSDAFDINNFKKLFADPMDVVIGLSIVPVDVPKGSTKEIKIGLVSTGVTMTQAASQYVTVDCGTIDVKEYWGSALDYSPYTKFSIYLPYIGTRDIKTDDIMGKTVHVKYNIDILSGSCTAMIKCGESVLYEYSGSCACSIPLTGNNWTSLVTAGIQLAGMGIAAAATGGASVAAAPTAATLGKAAGSAATYAAGNVSNMKPTVQRSGGVSGSAGMLGIQRPYLIAELPRQSLAKNYKSFVGYPSNITKKLSELSGYTEIEDVHLEDIPATTSELEEIHNLLVNGVIM